MRNYVQGKSWSGRSRSIAEHRNLLHGTAGFLALAVSCLPAAAQNATWIASPGSSDFNTAANWSPAAVPTDTAFFSASSTTIITFSSDTTIGGFTLNPGAPAYNFVNNQRLLFNSGTGIVLNGGSATITNNGSVGFAFVNAGNSVIINNSGGRVDFLPSSSAQNTRIINNAGGTVDITGYNAPVFGAPPLITIGSIEGAGNITFGDRAVALGNNAPPTTEISGIISGNVIPSQMQLQKLFPGTLILSGNNTYTGLTVIESGTLQLGNGGTTGLIVGDVFTNGILAFNRSNAIAFSGRIVGNGVVVQNGTGTLTLTGNNAYSGDTILNAGTISLGSNSALGTGSLITNGSVVDYANGVTIANPIIVNSNTTQLQVLTGTATQSGVISESGGARPIEKIGAGTLVLTASNTYTGGTTISAGTLQLGNGGTAGNITGNVTNNGTLAFNRSDAIAFSGTISGSGGLTKVGAETLTLSAINSYSGGTAINGGTLAISADDNLGAASGGIAFNGGTVQTLASISSARGIVLNSGGGTFNTNGFASTLSGTISGSGGLTKTGSGALTLTANNSYAGITTISGGSLQLGNGGTTGAIAGNVTNNSALVINRSNSLTLGGTISGTGSFTQSGSGTTILAANNTHSGGTTIASGTLQLGNGGTTGSVAGNVVNSGTLAFNRSNDYLFAGVISGTGGVVQNGPGVTTLSATNTYTGATVVNAGTLVVNGSIAASSGVTVNAGGALLGSGTIGNMTINGGTLAPGNSIGTVTVNGNLTFTGNSTYAVEVAPNAADLTTVTGVANVAGTLQATALGGTYTPGTQYTVINAAGGVSGTFGALTLVGDFTTAVRPRIAYDATRVYLVLDPNLLSPFLSGATANENATAQAMDQVFLGGNAPSPFLSLFGLSGGALNAAVASFSGEIHASTRTAALDDSRFVREAVMKRLSAGIASDNMTQDGNEIWGVAFGSWGHTASDGNAARFDRNIGGFLAGIDRTVGGAWRIGLAGGYSYSGGTATGLIGSKNDSTGHVAAYAGGTMGPWRLRLGAANAWNNFSTNRVAAFTGFSDTLRADYTGRTTQVFGEAGFHMDFDRLPVEPFVGATYVNLHTDSFRESGGVAALNGIAASNDVTFSTLGVRSGNMFGMMEGMVSVQGVLAWQHAYETGATRASLAIASANASFFAAGAPIAQDSALIQVGAGMNLSPGVNVSLDYTGRFASGFSDNGVKAYASWRF